MDKTKSIILSTIGIGLLYISLSILGGCVGYRDTSILRAIPDQAGLTITTSKLHEVCKSLNENNIMWGDIKKIEQLKDIAQIINVIDTTLDRYPDLRGMVYSNEVAISLIKEGKSAINPLLCIMTSENEFAKFHNIMGILASKNGYKGASGIYDKTKMYGLINPKTQKYALTYAYTEGILLISPSKLTTESAILQLHSGTSISAENEDLRKLLQTQGSNTHGSIIFNYAKLSDMLNTELASDNAIQIVKRQGEWCVMDIILGKQNISCSGYSSFRDNKTHVTKSIQDQKPVDNDFISMLPTKTTSFTSLGISDMAVFKTNYVASLKESDTYSRYIKQTETMKNKYDISMDREIYEILKNRITEIKCDFNLAGQKRESFIIAELRDQERTEEIMRGLCSKLAKIHNEKEDKAATSITSSTKKKFTAYKIPCQKLISSYFGSIFTYEPSYGVCYNGHLILGGSQQSLRLYINSIEENKTLTNNANYGEFTNLVNSKSNLFYYADIAYCPGEICKMLNKANANSWKKIENKIMNFRSAAMQITNDNDGTAYTRVALMHSHILEDERYIGWETPVDTTISIKPQVVTNHNTRENEVIVFDDTYKIYLFNKEGKILFKKQLSEPIASPVEQIDVYSNGKLQYLFATENHLQLIDRNGNYVDRFPLRLPASLSAEISVFDYDKNGTLRIFAPCSNKKIYLYDKEGLPVEGWPISTREPIITPVQYFRINGNDYLICSDNLKTYILNRRGEVRINVTSNYFKSKNSLFYVDSTGGQPRFITTSASGEIVSISMNGSCQIKTLRHNYSADHYFVLSDINGDGINEYIFTDNELLEVYTEDGKLIFSQNFDGSIGKPNIYKFSKTDQKIGVTCKSKNRIYLLNNKGDICNGFPLKGMSEFSICVLNNKNKFSVVTGGQANFLYNYMIQ